MSDHEVSSRFLARVRSLANRRRAVSGHVTGVSSFVVRAVVFDVKEISLWSCGPVVRDVRRR